MNSIRKQLFRLYPTAIETFGYVTKANRLRLGVSKEHYYDACAIATQGNAFTNQRVVDTGIVFDDVTIDMLYCDDTEVIEEHLANYQRCAEEHKQISEWLKELKRLKE